MKKILLLVALTICVCGYGQNFIEDNFPTENGKIKYTEVVNTEENLTASDLYLNAKKWMVDAFNSSKSVTQTDDKESGLIIAKSFVSKGHNTYVTNPKLWFILKLEFKEGRYRYTIYDIKYEFDINMMGQRSHTDKAFEEWIKPSGAKMSNKRREMVNQALTEYCQEVDAEFRSIVYSLKQGMNKNDSDDW